MTDDRSILVRAAEWLLGLDRIRLGRDAPIHLHWNSPFPGWLVLALGLVVLLFIAFAYRREQGRTTRRIILATLRVGLAGLVIALLNRPVLVLQRDLVSPSHVALLIDTSASMSRIDGDGGPVESRPADAASSELSRLDLVRRAWTADDAAALRALLERNQLRIYQFAGDAQPLAVTAGPADLEPLTAQLARLTADGTSTNLARSLEQVLGRTEGGRLAAVVLASDGQSTGPGSLTGAIGAAQAQQVPIYPLRVGSPIPPRDVGIDSVAWDGNVFAKDIMAVRVRLQATGLPTPVPVTVQLLDEVRGRVVAAATVEVGGEQEPAEADRAARVLGGERQGRAEPRGSVEVELRTKSTHAGRGRYRVQILPVTGDADADNDTEVFEVWVRDEPARVLYVEQQPRFEYRYLKNALVREGTVRTSVLLLSADAEFAQEGTAPIRRFPETPEELEGYEVVLFGDVDPAGDWLSPAQAQMLVEFVGRRGGGFGLIAGERNAPHRFRGTVLEKLVPVRIDPDFLGGYAETLTAPFVPRVTPEGERSRLFRFDLGGPLPGGRGSEAGETHPIRNPQSAMHNPSSPVSTLPGWYWFARTLGPRPGAEVLLEHPTMQGGDGPMPLVVLGRYGAGKTLFHASDDTWRWRRGAGELIYDGYWVQVVRTLMPAREPGTDRRLVLRPRKRRYQYGERVDVQVQINDPALLSVVEEPVRLTVHDRDDRPVAQIEAQRLGSASPLFEGSFIPPGAGTFSFAVEGLPSADPASQPVATASIQVERASLEFRRPEADHAALEHLAAETGGQVVPLERMTEVFADLRDRSVRIPDDVSETLWDSKLAFTLFVVLIAAEWILRKVYGMI
jgi:hypothetical protein